MSYIVSVDGPTRFYVHWNSNTNLPSFTCQQPEPMSLRDARKLKARADICCGGTLRVVKA
jgi:hypothetical protein